MKHQSTDQPGTVLFIPHGGGPLPLLNDEGHKDLIHFLKKIAPTLIAPPAAIVVISAHWEENVATITSGANPALIYDYFGFPAESYEIEYPAPGNPELAQKIFALLQQNNIEAKLDEQRGFDHGLFVPLKIMFPAANIPCVQLSLINNLEPYAHISVGNALSSLMQENILIIGSGFSFHNMRALLSQSSAAVDSKNEEFEHWLIDTCTNIKLSPQEQEKRLIHWSDAPSARYCHPREEHLLPLHICYGVTRSSAELIFDGTVLGKKTSAFLW